MKKKKHICKMYAVDTNAACNDYMTKGKKPVSTRLYQE